MYKSFEPLYVLNNIERAGAMCDHNDGTSCTYELLKISSRVRVKWGDKGCDTKCRSHSFSFDSNQLCAFSMVPFPAPFQLELAHLIYSFPCFVSRTSRHTFPAIFLN